MLAPCPTCRRHVDVAPGPCPFCHASHAVLTGRSTAPVTRRRSTRKAVTLVASLALVGCSGSDDTTATTTDATSEVAADTASADTGVDTASVDTGSSDTGSSDTGTKTDAVAEGGDGGSDATTDAADAADTIADTGFFPPYGHPPWDEALV